MTLPQLHLADWRPTKDTLHLYAQIVGKTWAGDDAAGDDAYYSYTAPEPGGPRDQPLSAGPWTESGTGSLAILPCEAKASAQLRIPAKDKGRRKR